MELPGYINTGPSSVAEKIRWPVKAADFGVPAKYEEEAQRFADFLVAAERERCAKVCEGQFVKDNPTVDAFDAGLNTGVISCIAAIRSPKEE